MRSRDVDDDEEEDEELGHIHSDSHAGVRVEDPLPVHGVTELQSLSRLRQALQDVDAGSGVGIAVTHSNKSPTVAALAPPPPAPPIAPPPLLCPHAAAAAGGDRLTLEEELSSVVMRAARGGVDESRRDEDAATVRSRRAYYAEK